MRVRVKFSEDAMRQFGYVPQTTFEAAGATYKAEDIAAWHGAAITMLSEALKGGELDTVRRLQLGDQMEGHEQAQARWAEAAKGGDVGAQYLIAAMYETGDGVPQDLRLARYWYGVAADNGDEAAPGKLKELELRELGATAPP